MAAPQLFNPQIIPTICDGSPQALNRLAQQTRQALQQLASGNGTIFRFSLSDTLSLGGSAPATILQFNTSDFSSIGSGTVYDEEPGGFWQGSAGDEGWCTGRNGQPGSYSIVFMELSMQTTIRNMIDASPSLPKAGGYYSATGGPYTGAAAPVQWSNWASISGSIYTADSPPMKYINFTATGHYLAYFSLCVTNLAGSGRPNGTIRSGINGYNGATVYGTFNSVTGINDTYSPAGSPIGWNQTQVVSGITLVSVASIPAKIAVCVDMTAGADLVGVAAGSFFVTQVA